MSDNNSKIEDIKRRLYEKQDTIKDRVKNNVIRPINYKVSNDWVKEENKEDDLLKMKKKRSISIYKKFFITAVIFFLGAVGYAIYTFLYGGVSVSNNNIDINILGNAFTKGGDELALQVEITNRNRAKLELANLIVEYPRGAYDDQADFVRLPHDSIGTIMPGETITRNIKVVLFGAEKSIRNVKAILEYHPEGSNAIFTKEIEYPVTISSAPLSINIESPESVSSNQLFTIRITPSLNTIARDENVILQVTYPNNFIFDSALPSPSIGNSVWDLSSLTEGNGMPIEIKGKIIGQDGEDQVFHVYAGAASLADKSKVSVVYNSLLQKIIISKPFLDAKILVNDQDLSGYTASGGEKVDVTISWVNNLSTRIVDARIITKISGNAFNRENVTPYNGFYDSANSQIIWDKNTVPNLSSIEPGESGSFNFSFKPISLVGISGNIKDPQVLISVSINGRQPSEGIIFNEVNNFTEKIVRILSDFQIVSSASYHSGFMPPKAEQETKYNITWTLSNSANNISGAIARTSLPIYVKWVGVVGQTNEKISYNEVNHEVIWNIGSVKSNTGFDSNREVSFTVSLNPSLSQVSSIPQLTKETYLSGTDTFTGTIIKSTKRPITTLLNNDPVFKFGDERVIN